MNYRNEIMAMNPLLRAGKEIQAIRRLHTLLESAIAEEEWLWAKTIALHLSVICDHAGMKRQAKEALRRVIDTTSAEPEAALLLALSHYEAGEERLALLRHARAIAEQTNEPQYVLDTIDLALGEPR